MHFRAVPYGWDPGPLLDVTITAYNSDPAQTDSTPFITATNTQTRPGVLAVSRDLLAGPVPYGSKVQVLEVDSGVVGCSGWVPDLLLDVEDTMHPRKTNQMDLWLEEHHDALLWGRCPAVVQVFYALAP